MARFTDFLTVNEVFLMNQAAVLIQNQKNFVNLRRETQ